MDAQKVQTALKDLGQPGYRWDQVRKAVYDQAAASYDEISVLPADVRRAMAEKAPILSLKERRVDVSSDGRAHKALLDLPDGKTLETVLLRPSATRWTTCISSQVGCAVACTFCATGLMGLSRNLTPEEITDQVLFWRQYMKKNKLEGRLDNVVYMGMGEPFACYEQVSASLKDLIDQKRFAIGARHISVSTSGIAPKIVAFGRDFPQVNLALSLHSATDELRSRLVPMNKAFDLAKLGDALKTYLSETNRKVFYRVRAAQRRERPRAGRRRAEPVAQDFRAVRAGPRELDRLQPDGYAAQADRRERRPPLPGMGHGRGLQGHGPPEPRAATSTAPADNWSYWRTPHERT
jgi:23S rRNA (adenine2503-C2)-methyltransferase